MCFIKGRCSELSKSGPFLGRLKLRDQVRAFSEALVLSNTSYTEAAVKFWHVL